MAWMSENGAPIQHLEDKLIQSEVEQSFKEYNIILNGHLQRTTDTQAVEIAYNLVMPKIVSFVQVPNLFPCWGL